MEQKTAIKPGAVRPRHLLTVVAVSIVVIGCLAVLSAADGAASGSAFMYFAKAAIVGALGLGLMAFLGRGGRRGTGGLVWAHRFTMALLAAGAIGVVFVMIPTPITPAVNGARQWITLGPFTIQPSEILKPALVLYLAAFFARDPWRAESLHDLRPALIVVGGALGLVAMQDLGSGLVTGGIVLTMFFIAGVPGRLLLGFLGLAAVAAASLTFIMPERIERVTVFLHPFADRYDAGFQITNGLMAIGQGGLFGNGIGESLQKHIMPEPQTDFILPVIMEEVGLLGASVIVALYIAIVSLGLRISRATEDPYDRLVAAGLSAIVLWQAALNIWVVLGIAPVTGVPLPLISAGSTSQLILLAVLGLLVDIDRRSAMPTVPLVLPQPRPVAPPRPAEPRRPRPAAAPVPAAAEPVGEELRVVDQRRAPAPQEIRAARTTPSRPAGAPARTGAHAHAAAAVAGAPARAPRPAAAPSVVERVANLELLSDGTVRLPNGRIGRPKSPIVLPDGRVLMPSGALLSRERAAQEARRLGHAR